MEYKTTTKLKQSTLWWRLSELVMTLNFTEYKAEAESPPPQITKDV